MAGYDSFQNFSTLGKALVDQYLAGCVKQIVGDQDHGHCDEQLSTDILSTQPLLEFTEGKDCFIVCRNDFAIDDDVSWQRIEWPNQFWKAMRDLVHGSGINSNPSVLHVGLRSNSVKLV